MKSKHYLKVISIVSALLLSGCGSKPSNNTESKENEYSSNEVVNSSNESIVSSELIKSEEPVISSEPERSSEESSDIPAGFQNNVYYTFDLSLTEAEDKEMTIEVNFNSDYFFGNSTVYNPALAKYALVFSMATGSKDDLKVLCESSGSFALDDTSYSMDHYKVKFGVAMWEYNGYNTFFVGFRGFNYGIEWKNNFELGSEDNHSGFTESLDRIKGRLLGSIKRSGDPAKTKVILTGYSRGGAIANMAAHYLMTNDEFKISQENLQAYTFEAPACLAEENAVAYPNVFNFVNSCDIITNVPPACYGLKRCGIDVELYDDDIDSIIRVFDDRIALPAFKQIQINSERTLENDTQVKDYVLNSIFNSTFDGSKAANTREQYVENYETGMSNIVGYLFALTAESRAAFLSSLKTMDMLQIFGILYDASGVGFADYLKTYLDQDNIEYDYDELVSYSAAFVKAISSIFAETLFMYIGENGSSVQRLIDMHYPEITLSLLNHYNIVNRYHD